VSVRNRIRSSSETPRRTPVPVKPPTAGPLDQQSRTVWQFLYEFHFGSRRVRYACLGLTVLLVFLYGVGNELLLGREVPRVAAECGVLAACALGILPLLVQLAQRHDTTAALPRSQSAQHHDTKSVLPRPQMAQHHDTKPALPQPHEPSFGWYSPSAAQNAHAVGSEGFISATLKQEGSDLVVYVESPSMYLVGHTVTVELHGQARQLRAEVILRMVDGVGAFGSHSFGDLAALTADLGPDCEILAILDR